MSLACAHVATGLPQLLLSLLLHHGTDRQSALRLRRAHGSPRCLLRKWDENVFWYHCVTKMYCCQCHAFSQGPGKVTSFVDSRFWQCKSQNKSGKRLSLETKCCIKLYCLHAYFLLLLIQKNTNARKRVSGWVGELAVSCEGALRRKWILKYLLCKTRCEVSRLEVYLI